MVTATAEALIRTLLYAVTITAFGMMALSVSIDPRSALESMAVFLLGFIVLQISPFPVVVATIVPLVAAIGVFVYRLRSTGRAGSHLFGRGAGRLLLGLMSAAMLVVGVFIGFTVVTEIGLAAILQQYGPARSGAILLLEAGPLLLGAVGFALLYRENMSPGPGPLRRPDRKAEFTADEEGSKGKESEEDDAD